MLVSLVELFLTNFKKWLIWGKKKTGTIGHVAHGKSTVVKALTGVLTVRFKNEKERNITIKLGYANAKVINEFKKNLQLTFKLIKLEKKNRFTNVIIQHVHDQAVIDHLEVIQQMNFHAKDLVVVVNLNYLDTFRL